jgi:hypothetical protein
MNAALLNASSCLMEPLRRGQSLCIQLVLHFQPEGSGISVRVGTRFGCGWVRGQVNGEGEVVSEYDRLSTSSQLSTADCFRWGWRVRSSPGPEFQILK